MRRLHDDEQDVFEKQLTQARDVIDRMDDILNEPLEYVVPVLATGVPALKAIVAQFERQCEHLGVLTIEEGQ